MEWPILWVRCTLCHCGDSISRQWSGRYCGWDVCYVIMVIVLADNGVVDIVGEVYVMSSW